MAANTAFPTTISRKDRFVPRNSHARLIRPVGFPNQPNQLQLALYLALGATESVGDFAIPESHQPADGDFTNFGFELFEQFGNMQVEFWRGQFAGQLVQGQK